MARKMAFLRLLLSFKMQCVPRGFVLYPMKGYNNYQPCWFRLESSDCDIYPKAREARGVSITSNPGKILLQPAGWLHQVHALDSPNMSVSCFWRYSRQNRFRSKSTSRGEKERRTGQESST